MKLIELLQTYEFEEIMDSIIQMFPGTRKYRAPLKQAYLTLLETDPILSDNAIHYQVMIDEESEESTMGAVDADFEGTWAECLGKDVLKDDDVELTDVEVAANCLVNLCFISQYPPKFENAHQLLLK
ncbi:MAG: hypothetical protein IKQ03_04360 [Prevotella sp.]|nr:hypothetical protein [Prevotella sp.]